MMSLIEQAKLIRLVIFDVDGVLTSGNLPYSTKGIEYKNFHVHDGQGMKFLQQAGVPIALITVCQTDIIKRRAQDLGIQYLYQEHADKLLAYEDLKKKLNLTDEQIAYVGDDLPDLPLLRRAGLAITVVNAPKIMRQYVHWTTNAKGGKGAVREVCDFILEAQNLYQGVIESFLQK